MGRQSVQNFFSSILVLATIILTGITVFASFTKSMDPRISTYSHYFELLTPELIIACLVVVLFWLWRRKVWFLIPLIAIAFNWNFIRAMIEMHTQEAMTLEEITAYQKGEANGLLTIASYNVHGFGNEIRGYSCKEMAKLFFEKNVDVICFQEFSDCQDFTVDSIKSTLHNWPYSYIPRYDEKNDTILSVAIFSRFPLSEKKLITYTESSNCSAMANIQVGENQYIRIINNHLQTTGTSQNQGKWERNLKLVEGQKDKELDIVKNAGNLLRKNTIKRVNQAEEICNISKACNYPVVCCGDFNSLPSSYVYYLMTQVLKDGFKECGKGYANTYRNGKKLLRIDYIFMDSVRKGMSYEIYKEELCSDHNLSIMTMKYQ